MYIRFCMVFYKLGQVFKNWEVSHRIISWLLLEQREVLAILDWLSGMTVWGAEPASLAWRGPSALSLWRHMRMHLDLWSRPGRRLCLLLSGFFLFSSVVSAFLRSNVHSSGCGSRCLSCCHPHPSFNFNFLKIFKNFLVVLEIQPRPSCTSEQPQPSSPPFFSCYSCNFSWKYWLFIRRI